MANRYWVGNGTWDASSTSNWSTATGGASGASVPTASDAVLFDANSGNCTLGANVTCLTMNMTGYTGTFDFVTYKISIAGNNVTVFTGVTTCTIAGTPVIDLTYSGSTGSRNINTRGVTEANSISFNVIAGSDTVTGGSGPYVYRNLNFSGFSGTWANLTRTVYGSLTLSSGMTVSSGANTTTFGATSGTKTITSNANSLPFPVVFNGAGGTWELIDNLTITGAGFTLTNGTFDAKGQNVSAATFSLGSGTKTLTLGSGTWTITGSSWNANTNVANLTVSASTGTISMTSGSAKTFSGGGKTWPTLNQGGAGALTIAQSNTFANITNTTQPATISLTAGTTQTVSAFGVSGTSGNQITLNSSSTGSVATLYKANGDVSVSYVSIQDVRADGPAEWNARVDQGAVDLGNTPGWKFISLAVSQVFRRVFRNVLRPVFITN